MLIKIFCRFILATGALFGVVSSALAQNPTPEQVEYFEKRVRPVLAQRCWSCHSAQQQFAGVRLDSPSFLSNPTPKGPKLIAPGDPSKSALILTVRYDGAVRMPPTGKIPQKEIDALTQWVKTGAAWPPEKSTGVNDSVTTKKALEQASRLWSLQAVKKPAIPSVQDSEWVKNPIDAFVLSKLEAKNLRPSKPADRRTLLRRASYDLIGLPPTPNEIAEFEKDASPNAWEKAVDRLLASPHYGERWGRHWLDIARYADTKGGAFFGGESEESRYPFAHSYRDWVIQAFNDDMSYPEFLKYQIAADKMNFGDDKKHLAALGFLTLGRRNQGDMQDMIDDRIDVVMRGTQALTVSCARCHDHKFDPIPTKDYYSLYGVFSASIERTVMLADASSQLPGVAESVKTFEQEKKSREGRVDRFLEAKRLEILAHSRAHITDYLLAAEDPLDRQGGGEETISGLKSQLIAQWKQFLISTRKSGNPALIPWNAFMTLPPAQWKAKTPALAARYATDKSINPLIAKAFAGVPPSSRSEIASRYATVFATIDSKWQRALKSSKERGTQAPSSLPDRWEEQIRQILYSSEISQTVAEQTESLLKEADRNRLQAMRLNVQRLLESPSSPQHALVLADSGNMPNPRVLIRGDLATPGEEVPRRFLLALAGEKREPFKDGSGRLELAQAIASPDNPLTARVMANRVWQGHFGQGIVRTPSDFGTRGEPPTHPELLDWLAATFAEEGWSLKKLHKTILLSNTYRQSDEDNPEARKADSDNRLLWRMNRRRLDFEQLRDSLLTAGGELDPAIGGRSVEIIRAPFSRRRTLYALVDRSNLPAMYRVFDFANPDAHSSERFVTTSPQQSLFLLNSPFVIDQAKRLIRRSDVVSKSDETSKIQTLYRSLFGREASEREIAIGAKFLKNAIVREGEGRARKPSPWLYGYGEYDEATKRVKSFTPLPYWNGEVWQVGLFTPDPDFGSLSLNSSGGAPGSDAQHAVIRRWVAPKNGYISVNGTLRHLSINGDGVRGRVVSSRTGLSEAWTVKYTGQDTNLTNLPVMKGDTLDFVVDCLKDDTEDNFAWTPTLTLTSAPVVAKGVAKGKFREAGVKWDAAADFGGPADELPRPLTNWEKYAQALLLSNEFAFTD